MGLTDHILKRLGSVLAIKGLVVHWIQQYSLTGT
jgi:hypothetical protein